MSDEVLDEILAPDYLAGIEDRTAGQLREMRAVCEEQEDQISYARRILQGRIDLVRAEAVRRDREEGLTSEVLALLPDVLSDHGERTFDPARVRVPRRLVPPSLDGSPLEDASTLDLGALTDADLAELAGRLAEHERMLSRTRRSLFAVIDRIQAELAERYRTGRASVSEVLGGQQGTPDPGRA